MMFNDLEVKHLAAHDISLGVYTEHQVHILGKCKFYILPPDTKKPHSVTFYVASNEGSVLLSCTTLLTLDLIQTRPHLDYLAPRAKLITSAAYHPDITKKTAHQSTATVKPKKPLPMKIVTKKSDIKEHYADVFEGVGCFPGPLYHIQVDPKIPLKQTSVRPVPVHLKEAFKQKKPLPMKIVTKKSDIKEHYADVFEAVGCFPGPPYHIQVDPKIPLKQTSVRPVPVHLKEAFKQELDKMLLEYRKTQQHLIHINKEKFVYHQKP